MNNAPFLAPCRPAAALLPLLLLAAALLAPAPALAHRVNIFAWLEGGDVVVECGFNRSSPVKNGLITVFDAVDGKELLQGHTDDAGRFSFPVPQAAREGHGLRIRINAGEGHQNEWDMDASEFSGAGNATNVGIIVSNENGTKGDVVFNGSEPEAGTDVANDATGATASVFNYTAKVIQVGDNKPTAGHYSSSAAFEVVYR